MLNTKTDAKNLQLLRMVAQLRDHIDIHRIIGLNVRELQEGHISGALLGYLQKSAHESLALYICKIFESSSRNDLNSIPGVIESLPSAEVSEMQRRELEVFGSKYGHTAIAVTARDYLMEVFAKFREAYSEPLSRLKEFRDTIGAHCDYRAGITSLPSHAEHEALFCFAKDFYELVSGSLVGVGPAVISRAVGHGFVRLIRDRGVQNARFDFEENQ